MRLNAYKQALNEANSLPESIPEYKRYFKRDYNPRQEAIREILKAARLDVKGLFNSEFAQLYEHFAHVRY
jgi:hypothetical protein